MRELGSSESSWQRYAKFRLVRNAMLCRSGIRQQLCGNPRSRARDEVDSRSGSANRPEVRTILFARARSLLIFSTACNYIFTHLYLSIPILGECSAFLASGSDPTDDRRRHI